MSADDQRCPCRQCALLRAMKADGPNGDGVGGALGDLAVVAAHVIVAAEPESDVSLLFQLSGAVARSVRALRDASPPEPAETAARGATLQ